MTDPTGADSSHGSIPDAAVRAEQTRLLYASVGIILVNLVNALIAAILLWRVYPRAMIVTWAGLMYIFVVARVLLWRRFQQRQAKGEDPAGWEHLFAIGSTAVGCLWGLLGSVVFMTDDPTFYLFVVFVLGGMTAGAAMRDSAYLPAFYGFAGATVLPMVAAVFARGGFAYYAMGMLLIAFTVVLVLVGRANNQWIVNNIRLRFRQASLNDELARTVAAVQKANAALEEREADLREAQRIAHIGNWAWVPATDKVDCSDELFRIFGRDPKSPILGGRDLSQFIKPEYHERITTALAACRQTGASFELDVEAIRADGTPVWISIRGAAVRDGAGQVTRAFGTAQDITVRKQAERSVVALHEQMARTVEALRRREAETAIVAKLSDTLQACYSLTEAYPIIATAAMSLFPDCSGALSLVSSETRDLETVTQWGADQEVIEHFPRDDCWALRMGHQYDVEGPGLQPACRHFKIVPPGAYACLPLMVSGEASGLLHLNAKPDMAIDADMRLLLVTLGDVVKLSLANLRLRERLSEQALRDQLTGLFNRHYLVESLPRDIRRAQRDRTALSVAMLDIDHFKEFNDAYGHAAGDVALAALGGLLRSFLRGSDFVCRFGGEEFFVVMPDCGLADARTRLQGLREEVKRQEFVLHGKKAPGVTVSIGLAQLNDDLASAEALIAAADRALYEAKRGGRDRIETYSGEVPSAPPQAVAQIVK